MGHGTFQDNDYQSSRATRAAAGIDDFEYTKHATRIHELLDPARINKKPAGILESRDSVEHPISTPIILTFDVTGSNIHNAKIAQKRLPELMAKVAASCENPQIAIWANDDVKVQGNNSIQVGEFESDIRIDETIRNIWLTSDGGGNGGESYDLLLYAASRKTVTDSLEKRNKKGYMFLYADELFFTHVSKHAVELVFQDTIEADIPIATMVFEAKKKWNIFVLWPSNGYSEARAQYVTLFGEDNVEDLEGPNMLCEKVASIVAREEGIYKQNNQAQTYLAEELQSRVV